MDQALFRRRFLEAADLARDFAQQFVLEALPRECVFHLHLNQSYDRNAPSEVILFPEDSSPERALRDKHISAEQVIAALWRDGLVPEWVDVKVVGETGTATVVGVQACGRFTADEARLYHARQGRPPFQALGPTLPVDYVEGRPFSIYTRSTCWTEADMIRAQERADNVWSLELNGPAFCDATLLASLKFPRLEILELWWTAVEGSGLRGLGATPKLRVFRIGCGKIERLDLRALPVVETMKTVELLGLPAELSGVSRLSTAFPFLLELTLAASEDVIADSELRIPGLNYLSLEFPRVQNWARRAPAARRLSLRYLSASDDEVAEIVHSAGDSLTSIWLRDTPVTDRIFVALDGVRDLSYVDLVDTRVTREALEDFARSRPNLKSHPRPLRNGAV